MHAPFGEGVNTANSAGRVSERRGVLLEVSGAWVFLGRVLPRLEMCYRKQIETKEGRMRQSDESFDRSFSLARGAEGGSAGPLHPSLARVHPDGGAWCDQERQTSCSLTAVRRVGHGDLPAIPPRQQYTDNVRRPPTKNSWHVRVTS